MQQELEERIRRLEVRESIRELAARYTFAVDNRDLRAIENCFAKDALFRSRDGVMKASGREAIMEQFRGRFEVLGPGAHYGHDHVVILDETDRDRANGFLSSHAELFRNGKAMVTSLRYDDRYVREEGRWVFADRLLSFFYYLNAEDYISALGDRKRMRAYDAPQEADFPENLPTWRSYHDAK